MGYTEWYTKELRDYYKKKKKLEPQSQATSLLSDWSRELYVFANDGGFETIEQEYDAMLNQPNQAELVASGWYDNSLYGAIDPRLSVAAPELSMKVRYLPMTEEERSIFSVSKAYEYLSAYYGDENLARYFGSMLTSIEPEQRELAIATLNQFAQKSFEPMGGIKPAEPQFDAAGRELYQVPERQYTQAVSDEVLAQVMEHPETAMSLTPEQRNWIIEFAQDISASGNLSIEAVSEAEKDVYNVAAAIATRNFGAVLTPQQIENLKSVEQMVQTGEGGPKGLLEARNFGDIFGDNESELEEAYRNLGIYEVRYAGTDSPEVIFQEEEMLDPVKRAVITAFMEDKFPNMRYRIGDGGPIAHVMYAWDRAIDYTSGAVLAATPLDDAVQGINEGWEAAQIAVGIGDSRGEAEQKARKLDAQIIAGEIPLEELPDALRELNHLKDRAMLDAPLTPVQAWEQTVNPQEAGFGFADTMLGAADILPGDTAYGAARAGLYFTSQIAFDPVNYIVPGWSGAKAANKGFKTFTDSVARGYWKDVKHFDTALDLAIDAGDDAGKIVTEILNKGGKIKIGDETLNAAQVAERLRTMAGKTPGNLLEEMATRQYIILHLDDVAEASPFKVSELVKGLQAKGDQVVKLSSDRKSLMVLNASTNEGYVWAKRLGLRSFRSGDGLVDVASATIRQNKGIGVVRKGIKHPSRTYTFASAKGNKLRLAFDMTPGSQPLRVAGIGGGYIRNAVFSKLAPTLDEWVANPAIDDAVDVIMAAKASAAGDAANFAGRLQKMGMGDSRLIEMMWSSKTHDNARLVLQSALTGGINVDDMPDLLKTIDVLTRREKKIITALKDKGLKKDARAALRGELDDVYTERKYYESVLRGNTNVEPLRNIPKGFLPSEAVRAKKAEYKRLAEPWSEDLMIGATDYAAGLPAWAIEHMEPKLLERLIEGDGRIRSGFRKMLNSTRDMSAGESVVMPWQVIAGKEDPKFANTVSESMTRVRNVMKQFDVPEDEIQRIIGRMELATDEVAGNDAWVDMWETIATKGRRVDARSANELKRTNLYATEEGSTPALHGADNQPTNWRYIDVNGEKQMHAQPAWTAHKRQTYTLPTAVEIKKYSTRMGQWLARSQREGKVARTIPFRAIGGVMEGYGTLWKTMVLVGKMPVSLVSRIITEEQLRIAAFGYGSVFNHPVEWFRGVRNSDELALFLRSPEYGVGVIERDLLGNYGRWQKSGRLVSRGNNSDVYAHGITGHLNALAASPESRLFLATGKKRKSAKQIWRTIQNKADGGVGWAKSQVQMLNASELGPIETIKRMQAEVDAVIGGDKTVAAAIRTGRYGGKALDDAGTWKALKQRMEAGQWNPTLAQVRTNEIIGGTEGRKGALRDAMFEWLYSKPDLNASRNPLFMQLSRIEYQKLVGQGWSHTKALDAAKFHAARQVSDMLFKVGGSNSIHYFMRNISPFMPAWQELLETWSWKVPKAMGAGHVSVGYARMGHIFHALRNAAAETGALKQDPATGAYYIDVGPARIYVSSIGGVLPLPTKVPGKDPTSEVVTDLGPGIGALPQTVISQMAQNFDGYADAVADWTLYSTPERSLIGPASLANAWEAVFNSPAPWELTTQSFREKEIKDAMWDGMRIAMQQNPAPKQSDYKKLEAYQKAFAQWATEIVEAGTEYQTTVYAHKALAATFSPYNLYPDKAPENLQLGALQKFLDIANEEGDNEGRLTDYQQFIMRTWAEAHPDMDQWILSNRINLDDTPFDKREWGEFQEWADQQYETIPEAQLPYWYAVRMEERNYTSERAKLRAQLGTTVGSYLANNEVRQKLTQQWFEHDNWLRWMESTGQGKQAVALAQKRWEHINGLRESPYEVTLSLDQENAWRKAQELKDRSNEIYWKDGRKTDAYFETIGPVMEVVETINWADPQTQLSKDIDRYYRWAGEYYDKRNELYDKANALDRPLQGPIWDELRRLATDTKPLVIRGEVLPTPEEYAYWNRTEIEKQDAIVDWSSKPVEWLTPFQRETLGIYAPEGWDKFADWKAKKEQEFKDRWAEVWPSDRDRVDARAALDAEIEKRVEKLGLGNIWNLNKIGTYNRISSIVDFDSKAWELSKQWADEARGWILDRDARFDSDNTTSRRMWGTLLPMLKSLEETDPKFAKIMEDIGIALAPPGTDKYQDASLYLKLYFDYWDDYAPYWAARLTGGKP